MCAAKSRNDQKEKALAEASTLAAVRNSEPDTTFEAITYFDGIFQVLDGVLAHPLSAVVVHYMRDEPWAGIVLKRLDGTWTPCCVRLSEPIRVLWNVIFDWARDDTRMVRCVFRGYPLNVDMSWNAQKVSAGSIVYAVLRMPAD